MLSPSAVSAPSSPSSSYSTPSSTVSDGSGSFSLISLPPTHASEQTSDSLVTSFSTLQLSPSSIDSDSSKGSSPATLSPPVTRSPSPPQKSLKEKKHWRPLAGASSEVELKLQFAKSRQSSGQPVTSTSTHSPQPIPLPSPLDPPYLLPYTQMAPCVLLPSGQFVVLNPLEWAHMTAETGAYVQYSPQQASLPVSLQTGHSTASDPTGVATPLMEVPTAYVQPTSAWAYDCRPYLVPQMIDGFVPSTNGRRRVRPGYCLFIFHLPPETVDEELFQLFSQYGTVFSAKVIRDKSTQDSKGYGFVNMATEQQADYAIERLNGSRYKNKYLKVSYKKKKKVLVES